MTEKQKNQKTKKLKNLKTFVFLFSGYSVFWLFGIASVYALNLDNLKTFFINGDYRAAIKEGEFILSSTGKTEKLDELYYILGLSYLKDGNYLRAWDIFEIIIKEFKKSPFVEEARLGLADVYFLRRDYLKAQEEYEELLREDKENKFKASLYSRLSECAVKSGDAQAAKNYLEKLKKEFPLNVESEIGNGGENIDIDFCYSVQVGSFSNSSNADNLTRDLEKKGYDAYIEKIDFQGKDGNTAYRVKTGKFRTRQEAVALEAKLSLEGYPTKIRP